MGERSHEVAGTFIDHLDRFNGTVADYAAGRAPGVSPALGGGGINPGPSALRPVSSSLSGFPAVPTDAFSLFARRD